MTHSLPSATSSVPPNPLVRPGSHPGRMGSLARGLTGAVVVILLIVLAIGPIIRQYGWPGGSGGLLDNIGLFAPGTLTSGNGPLSCASPGYRPVVEGTSDSDSLAAIGITEAPIQIDGVDINIPTSTGATVTLPNTWTSMGGPMWANTNTTGATTTVRNIETEEEWTFPSTGSFFPGIFNDPYLIVPASADKTDWRIVDTTTGSERLISDIRGEPFPVQVEISSIGTDPDQRTAPADTSVWLFSTFPGPEAEGQPPQELGPNALVLPRTLTDAAFIPDTVDATYFHETVYSPATQQLAFATGAGPDRSIVIIEPESGARIVVQDERFSDRALPLTFSDDGSTLVIDQPDALFSVSLTDDASVTRTYQGKAFVPIAHDAGTMNVLVMFQDRHVAIVDAASGKTTDLPGVTIPASEYGSSRLSFATPLHDVFDDNTSTVRFIDLAAGSVSAETAVLNPKADFVDAPIQPEFEIVVPYPHVVWADSHAFLDERSALQVVSTTDEDSFSILPPDDFSVGTNQVVDLLVSPGQRCVVLNLREPSGVTVVRNGEQIDSATTWVAPLEPGATWTRLDFGLVGWREVYEAPVMELHPASNIASPMATPG